MLVASLCWWLNDGDHFKMLMTKKYVGFIFLHVGDLPISHQHHNMPECDVRDRYVMLETWNSNWCQVQWNFSPSLNISCGTFIGHQHHFFAIIWCWCQTLDVGYVTFLSPTHLVSNIRHQHRCNQQTYHQFEKFENPRNSAYIWPSTRSSIWSRKVQSIFGTSHFGTNLRTSPSPVPKFVYPV